MVGGGAKSYINCADVLFGRPLTNPNTPSGAHSMMNGDGIQLHTPHVPPSPPAGGRTRTGGRESRRGIVIEWREGRKDALLRPRARAASGLPISASQKSQFAAISLLLALWQNLSNCCVGSRVPPPSLPFLEAGGLIPAAHL